MRNREGPIVKGVTFTDNGTVTIYESSGILSLGRNTTGTYAATLLQSAKNDNSYIASGIFGVGSDSTQGSVSEHSSSLPTNTVYTFYVARESSTLINAYRGRIFFTELR